jgi:hypothetical protein
MALQQILSLLARHPAWHVLPPSGLPCVADGDVLPADIVEFYTYCGGAVLGQGAAYEARILPPQEWTLANVALLGMDATPGRRQEPEDASWHWYRMVDCGNGDAITIDCRPSRNGWCYDSTHETYGVIGQMAIVAFSFGELLSQLCAHAGEQWYWLAASFPPKGDAYGGAINASDQP